MAGKPMLLTQADPCGKQRPNRKAALRSYQAAASLTATCPEPRRVITALFNLVDLALRLYVWALILAAVVSMLTAFNVLDTRNRLVWSIGDFLYRATDPVLRPIRKVLPNLGGIDLSPLIVIALIEIAVRPLLRGLYSGLVFGSWQPMIF